MAPPTIKLNSGHDMPLVGFGLWKVNNDTCADQVYHAIKAGYRLFDGACGKLLLGHFALHLWRKMAANALCPLQIMAMKLKLVRELLEL
jgi:hypothetical protein